MFEFLEKLRNKPRGTKKRIAFLTSFTFTSIILAFWLVSIYPSFQEQNNIEKKVKKIESSPIVSVGSVFSDSFSKIKTQLGMIKELGQNFTKEAEYYSASSTIGTTSNEIIEQNTANAFYGVDEDLP